MSDKKIEFLYLSQEDLIKAGCFDFTMTIPALEHCMKRFTEGGILFPDKIVQIFNEETQDRINCLPATLLDEKICGVKWVSVFPGNPRNFGVQNLSAIIVLSNIVNGFPVCVMDGTMCSNIRVASMGATAAKYLSRENSESIGFIGAGEQAKMQMIAMKSVRPGIKVCRVSSRRPETEQEFIRSLKAIMPDVEFIATNNDMEAAVSDADIIVTAVSCQAPLLKADWIKKGAFYNHIGGWEDEYECVLKADKIVCDSWETVKHRTQTVSRCYKEGLITDADIHGNLSDIITGKKPGRESDDEFIYFDAVGLSYIDVTLANAMYERAKAAGVGTVMPMQESGIFEKDLAGKIIF